VRSVVDDLRRRDREAVARLSPAERLRLALALGDDDLAIFRRARGLDEATARRELQRRKRHGRAPSRSVEGLGA
jgi:hypothetical protein